MKILGFEHCSVLLFYHSPDGSRSVSVCLLSPRTGRPMEKEPKLQQLFSWNCWGNSNSIGGGDAWFMVDDDDDDDDDDEDDDEDGDDEDDEDEDDDL